jgi:hypothetical protein
MNERPPRRTKQWIAHIGFLVFCGVAGFFIGDRWAHPRSGIVGVWGNNGKPSIAFYPDHTFAYINPDGLSGKWYELKEPGTFLLVYSHGFTVRATLQRRPLRLNYTEWDMMCSFEKVGSFASTK